MAAGAEATPKTLTVPIAVNTILSNNPTLIEQSPAVHVESGSREEKPESDREPPPGDDVHSEATVSALEEQER